MCSSDLAFLGDVQTVEAASSTSFQLQGGIQTTEDRMTSSSFQLSNGSIGFTQSQGLASSSFQIVSHLSSGSNSGSEEEESSSSSTETTTSSGGGGGGGGGGGRRTLPSIDELRRGATAFVPTALIAQAFPSDEADNVQQPERNVTIRTVVPDPSLHNVVRVRIEEPAQGTKTADSENIQVTSASGVRNVQEEAESAEAPQSETILRDSIVASEPITYNDSWHRPYGSAFFGANVAQAYSGPMVYGGVIRDNPGTFLGFWSILSIIVGAGVGLHMILDQQSRMRRQIGRAHV